MGRPRRGDARVPPLRHGPHRAARGDPPDLGGPAPVRHPAVVDHRWLRLHGGRNPGHDGHSRRPHRTASAADGRRRGVRRGVAHRGVRHERGDADRGAAATRRRGRDDRALHAVADLPHVQGRPAALARGGRVDRGVLGGQRRRAGAGRARPRLAPVGRGLPARAAGDGCAAGARAVRAPGVPRPGGGQARPALGGDVDRGRARGRLRDQAGGRGRADGRRARCGRRSARSSGRRGCGASGARPIR